MKKLLLLVGLWAVLTWLAMSQAFAAAPVNKVTWNNTFYSAYGFATATLACARFGTGRSPVLDGGEPANPTAYMTVYCQLSTPSEMLYVQASAAVVQCADGSAPNTALPTNSQCPEPAPVCATGTKAEKTIFQGTKGADGKITNYAFPLAVDGCMIRVTSLKGCTSTPPSNDVYCTYRYTVNQPAVQGVSNVISTGEPTGALKEEIVSGAAAANGEGCPSGTVSTGVSASGMVQCAGTGTNPASAGSTTPTTVKPPVTTANPDGSSTVKQDTVTTNKDGSTTTTTSQVTTLGDGSKTSSSSQTTGKAADGTSGVPDAKVGTDPNKSDLCALHPELNLCKNSTFSGTCGDVACTGDAIQCGILKAAAKKACDDQTLSDTLKNASYTAKGQGMMDGVADPTLPTKQNATSWTIPSSLDNQGWLGGGSCFPDKQFTVRGYSFTLSFTKACDPLVALRYALMIIALLASFRMLSGAILKD